METQDHYGAELGELAKRLQKFLWENEKAQASSAMAVLYFSTTTNKVEMVMAGDHIMLTGLLKTAENELSDGIRAKRMTALMQAMEKEEKNNQQ